MPFLLPGYTPAPIRQYPDILRRCPATTGLSKPAFALVLALYSPFGIADYAARVEYVIDGDTVVLENRDKLRLIGINAPELDSSSYSTQGYTAQAYALEARLALVELVAGRQVDVVPGVDPRDYYGRLLAKVMLKDGTDVQQELLLRGYACAIAIPPNIQNLGRYLDAERIARADRLGIWSDPDYVVDLDSNAMVSRPGFAILAGTVTGVNQSKSNYYFSIGNKLTIQLPGMKWQEYWPILNARAVMGQRYEMRGWVKKRNDGYFVLISHPSMMVLQ